jgi:hypothetical protein
MQFHKFLLPRNSSCHLWTKILSLVVSAFSLLSCGNSRKLSPILAQGLRVYYPALTAENKIIDLLDTAYIYEYKDFCLYQMPYHVQYSVNFEYSHEGRPYKYLFFKMGDSLGRMFDSTGELGFRPPLYDVEAIAKQRLHKGTDFSIVLDSLEFVKAEQNGSIIREAYFIKNNIGPQMMDSIILYFDKKRQRSYFSFGKRIEALKQAMLFRAEVHFNGGRAQDGSMVPRRIFEFDLFEIKTIKPDVVDFIHRLANSYDSTAGLLK